MKNTSGICSAKKLTHEDFTAKTMQALVMTLLGNLLLTRASDRLKRPKNRPAMYLLLGAGKALQIAKEMQIPILSLLSISVTMTLMMPRYVQKATLTAMLMQTYLLKRNLL